MSLWRQLTRGLRVLGNRKVADREIADEVNYYLQESTEAFLAQGLSPDEARRAARVQLGSATAVREQVREYGWENRIERFFADLRYAARRLRKTPGFTVTSVLTLALGIGASTAIFAVIDGVLLKPLPYPHSDQLVALLHTAPGLNIPEMNLAASLYFTYREENRVFQDVAMWTNDSWTVTGMGLPEEVTGLTVSDGFLGVLRVQPALGRGFKAADENPNGERTVMLSDGYWKSRFGADRGVIGRRIRLDGNAYTVIGVLPPTFQFLDRKISLVAPFRIERSEVRLISFCCQGIARLKPGITVAQANADVARMLPMAPSKFALNPGWSPNAFADARFAPRLRFLKDVFVGDIARTLWVLMAAVGILLAIACANVGNLLLVRADGRQQEFATRAALGAGWGRLARELLVESTMVGLIGGAQGLAIAYGSLHVLVTSDVPHLPRVQDISIDPSVLLFALILSLASGLLFGLIPVFRYARPQVASGLRSGGRLLTNSRERHRARRALLIAQTALALLLLVGSGLMIRTFLVLRHVEPGFSGAAEIETVRTGIPETQIKEPKRVVRIEEQILRKIESLPGVSNVAITSSLPLEGGENEAVFVEGQQYAEGSIGPVRRFKYVSPGYVAAIGSHLIAGRDFTWSELYKQTPVILVSENMARELWSDPHSAIGKRIRVTLKDDWREVIGVVADLHDDGVDRKAPDIAYWPLLLKNFQSDPEFLIRGVAYLIRTPRAGSAGLRREIQQAVESVNPSLAVTDIKTLDAVYEQSLGRTSFALVLLAIAGGMALLLAVVGIYGVISYSVAQRTREVGIRIALGASLPEVTGLFIRDGLATCAIGAALGLIAAFISTHLMKSLLFEVSPADPATYIAASVALTVAAFFGSYLPARRTARVDPAEALRAE